MLCHLHWRACYFLILKQLRLNFYLFVKFICFYLHQTEVSHLFADDTQLLFLSSVIHSSTTYLCDVLEQISSWMTANLNSSEEKIILIRLTRQLAKISCYLLTCYHSLCSQSGFYLWQTLYFLWLNIRYVLLFSYLLTLFCLSLPWFQNHRYYRHFLHLFHTRLL